MKGSFRRRKPDAERLRQEIAATTRYEVATVHQSGTAHASGEAPRAIESREPPADVLKRALGALEEQHGKSDATLLAEGIRRDDGIGAIPFSTIQERILRPDSVESRRVELVSAIRSMRKVA